MRWEDEAADVFAALFANICDDIPDHITVILLV